MIDFWKDYNPSSNEEIPSMRGIDYERIKAYCEAIGVDCFKQSINAAFMNEMEDWYLNLAKQYSALDKIRAEITQEYTRFRNKSDMWSERACGLGMALEIIDKYRKVEE